MSAHPGTFLTGLVLGLGVGLLAGHVTIWNRSPPLRFQLADGPGGTFEFEASNDDLQRDWSADVAQLLDEGWADEDLPAEDAAAAAPIQNAVSRRSEGISPDTESDSPAALVVPRMLRVADAAPLKSSGPSKADQATRAIIDQELADLPLHQREVWYESLQGMGRDDVAGVLRMWKLFGGHPPAPSLVPHPPESVQEAPVRPPPPATPAGEDWQSQLIAILRTNLRMAGTPGYLRQAPLIAETRSEQGLGPLAVDSRFDTTATTIVSTGIPLDLAIEGPGFFAVENDRGERFYTRNGRFSLDPTRRLALIVAGEELALQPEITIPDEFRQLTISPRGEVRIVEGESAPVAEFQLAIPVSLAHLRYHANGLLTLDEKHAREMPFENPGAGGAGQLRQGALELPVIDPAREAAEVRTLLGSDAALR